MCVQPGRLPNGTEIACRKCWQCRSHRIEDWVGRCIAEKQISNASHAITLTYGRDDQDNVDHFRAAWLTYSDIQKYFKVLRRAGYQFSYLVAGEYGSMKGRAHWHLLMFWHTEPPPHELTVMAGSEKRFNDNFWPHGSQLWQRVEEGSIRYVCKYINKDVEKDERQAVLRMSKKPPLGDGYFRMLADKYALQGLAPQTLKYSFPEVRDKEGRPRQFVMRGVTADNFLAYFKRAWAGRHGGFEPPSPVLEAYEDRLARDGIAPATGQWAVWVPPLDMGSGPFVGRDPLDGLMKNYSDLFGDRYWYRKTEEGSWTWVREGMIDGMTALERQTSIQSKARQERYLLATKGD